MHWIIKFIIELIAILLIWIAVGYKREKEYLPFYNKEWWLQFAMIFIAVAILKNTHKF